MYRQDYTDVIDETLLKIILNTTDLRQIKKNCECNETINKVCIENKELIGYELLKKRGYKNGNYSRFRRFLKLDPLLQINVKNIIKLYKLNDIDLLEMILDKDYNINITLKQNVQELANIVLDTVYGKVNSSLLLLIKLVHYDLFETKHLPDENTFKKLQQEHNKIFNVNLSLQEYINLFTIKITERINFTNVCCLETKLANMLKKWDYWIDNPIK